MSKPNIGKILDADATERDAIHVPIIKVFAFEALNPGDKIKLTKELGGDSFNATKAPAKDAMGIVDPYLAAPVKYGQQFYCFIKPGTVRKLWHDWTHNDIDKKK